MSGGRELHSVGPDGTRQDAHLHDPILTNEVAARRAADMAIQRAIASGIDAAEAVRLYGHRSSKKG